MAQKNKKISLLQKIDTVIFERSAQTEETLDKSSNNKAQEVIIEHELNNVSVEEEKQGRQIIEQDTDRMMSRVLYITTDVSYLENESKAITDMLNMKDLFNEIHIMVLIAGTGKDKIERVADNIWTYRVYYKNWWSLPTIALNIIKEQLFTIGGFRPDIVVALDPFESGLAGLKISKKINIPFQVHVYDNFLDPTFLELDKRNRWRLRMAKHVLKRTKSVRAKIIQIQESILYSFHNLTDVVLLPQYFNFKEYTNSKPSLDVHEKYKDFVFIALAFGSLTADSHLHDTFLALNKILHDTRIGLIVIGTGPAKNMFEEKVKLLGIEKNVVFLSQVDDLVSYLSTSDVLIQTDTTQVSENVVLQAAAAGLPLVMYETDMRKDLFENGESAALCETEDVTAISKNVTELLNDLGLRIRYKKAALNTIETRLQEDESTYYRAYRDSIESALVQNAFNSAKNKTKNKEKI